MKVSGTKKLSEYVSQFVRLGMTVQDDANFSREEVQKADGVLQDYLHQLENCSAKERGKIATALASSRKNRRKHKDVVYVTAPLVDWLNKNKDSMKELERVLGEIRRREKLEKVYYPRSLAETPIRSGKTITYNPAQKK